MDAKKILLILVSSVAVIGLLYGAWAVTSAPQEVVVVQIDSSGNRWVKGNEESKVTIVEFSDFQCPACKAFAPIISAVVEQNKDDIQFAYRHFPLGQHKNAEPAAYAAEAAGQQGAFYEMHDLLFANQEEWSAMGDPEETFIQYAQELELDVEAFTEAYGSSEVKKNVDADASEGMRIGVNSTPSFYINGQKLANVGSIDDFQSAIDAALQD